MNGPNAVRVAARWRTAGFTFREEKSPLTYTNGFRNVQRLSLCDSDFVQPMYSDDDKIEKRRGKPKPDQYFVEREVWRHHSNRRPYKRLKKPVLDERIPGVSDPCIVAFLDYTKYGDDYFALAYIRTRGGQQGRGHATMLIEEFFRRHRKAKEIRWGKMMQPHIGHLWEKMQRKYPHIAQSGFPNWGGTKLNPRKR